MRGIFSNEKNEHVFLNLGVVVVVDPFCYMTFSMIAQLSRAGWCDSHFLLPYASS